MAFLPLADLYPGDAGWGDVLFVSACVPNQSRFYDRFDHIVLLTASPELTVQRLSSRTDNPYGKSADTHLF